MFDSCITCVKPYLSKSNVHPCEDCGELDLKENAHSHHEFSQPAIQRGRISSQGWKRQTQRKNSVHYCDNKRADRDKNVHLRMLILWGIDFSSKLAKGGQMKEIGMCPKCKSGKVGYLENVIQRTDGIYNGAPVRGHSPAPAGIERKESNGFLKVIQEGPVGQLEAYLCASCGYFETYLKEPGSVPFESIVGFRWVNGG